MIVCHISDSVEDWLINLVGEIHKDAISEYDSAS